MTIVDEHLFVMMLMSVFKVTLLSQYSPSVFCVEKVKHFSGLIFLLFTMYSDFRPPSPSEFCLDNPQTCYKTAQTTPRNSPDTPKPHNALLVKAVKGFPKVQKVDVKRENAQNYDFN